MIDFQAVPATAVYARTVIFDPLLAAASYPVSLILTLFVRVYIGHALIVPSNFTKAGPVGLEPTQNGLTIHDSAY